MFDKSKLMAGVQEVLYGSDQDCVKDTVIKKFVLLVKVCLGTDAVGIRLHEGDDFPYYTTIGFTESFVVAENSLCGRDASGNLILDKDGRPMLACTCGALLRGKISYGFPGCTSGGSLCVNSTSALLTSIPENNLPSGFRGRCHKDGYESVCLVPIRHNSNTIGLLQANSQKQDAFDGGVVEVLEDACGLLAELLEPILEDEARIAEENRQMGEHLRLSAREISDIILKMPDPPDSV